MSGDHVKSSQSLLDLNFQSLASQELDLKQMELDSAAAKLDELKKDLENRRASSRPGVREGSDVHSYQSSSPSLSPSVARRSHPTPAPSLIPHKSRHSDSSLSPVPQLSASSTPAVPPISISLPNVSSPSFSRRSVTLDSGESYLNAPSHAPRGRPTSPRPQYYDRAASPRLSTGTYDYNLGQRSASPIPEAVMHTDRSSSLKWAQPYEVPSGYNPARFSDDTNSLRRRTQQRSWNESDLDLGYEKKASQDNRGSVGGVPLVKAWRETSLDPVSVKGKGDGSSTLPRSYKVSSSTDWDSQSADPGWRGGSGSLPRQLPPQQPISRIQVPPPGGRGQAHRPLPLSMIMRLQSAIWEHQAPPTAHGTVPSYGMAPAHGMHSAQRTANTHGMHPAYGTAPAHGMHPAYGTVPTHGMHSAHSSASSHVMHTVHSIPPAQDMPPAQSIPPTHGMPSHQTMPHPNTMQPPPPISLPETPEWTVTADPPAAPSFNEEVPRPLSPTRLQPNLPPSLAEVQRVLEEIPRPLRRRGSQELTAHTPPLPSDRRQYRQIMSRLFGRASPKQSYVTEQPKAEEKLQGTSNKRSTAEEQVAEEESTSPTYKIGPILEEVRPGEQLESSVPKPSATPVEPICVILETSESRVGASAPMQGDVDFGVPVVISGSPTMELRSALKGRNSPRRNRPQRARLDPLILLLDGALTGELEVVTQALQEVNDPSQPNEEGITALHNAICGANYHIVNLLLNNGANVNAADSHGWTPLHCAASCNDLQMCAVLVRHGAAIFATTYSDGSLPVEKCDPYREGYKECITYLTEVEQCMGETQSGVVYALWDYPAEFADELSLREGDSVTVLRKDGEGGTWWWASLCGREGYVPRNYFGLYPRIRLSRTAK
ncbi:relA-associated inhibitor isoform 2-T2 [Rhinophrynus dorsalis]